MQKMVPPALQSSGLCQLMKLSGHTSVKLHLDTSESPFERLQAQKRRFPAGKVERYK